MRKVFSSCSFESLLGSWIICTIVRMVAPPHHHILNKWNSQCPLEWWHMYLLLRRFQTFLRGHGSFWFCQHVRQTCPVHFPGMDTEMTGSERMSIQTRAVQGMECPGFIAKPLVSALQALCSSRQTWVYLLRELVHTVSTKWKDAFPVIVLFGGSQLCLKDSILPMYFKNTIKSRVIDLKSASSLYGGCQISLNFSGW